MKTLEDMMVGMTAAQREAMDSRFVNIGRVVDRCPHIIALIGLPASGKSTWTARYLEGNPRETTVLSTDNQIDALAKAAGKTYSQIFPSIDMSKLEAEMSHQQRTAVALNRDMIVDRTNMRVKSRRRWLSQVPKHYVRIGLVFEVPLAVLHQRLFARGVATGKTIPKNVISDMMESYQEPTFEEFDVIAYPNREMADAAVDL